MPTVDISDFERLCDRAEMFFDRSAPVIAAEILTEQILKDTAKGQKADGTRFAPYAPSQVVERKRLGLPTNKVTLRRSGSPSMLDTIKKRKIDGKNWVTVVESQMDKAEGLTKGVKRINLPAREIFDYTEATEEKITREIGKEFENAVK